MVSLGRDRYVVAVCHARSHFICSAALDSKPACGGFGEPNGSPNVDEPSTGVAAGVGASISLGGGKTDANIWSCKAVMVEF